ncbi:MAG TPA: tetratricopeptide repeat protein, partial [Chthoniobacterales bacterium]
MAIRLPQRWTVIAICIALALIAWLVFGETRFHDFVNYDDGEYVYKNPQVTRGLTVAGAVWAFSHTYAANWHPLTWLSHMLDAQLFGLNAGGHHVTAVLLHTATAILLFLVLRGMTGRLWLSAIVAGLFVIHPLRVESVAWIAERKDLLSGLFFVLTIGAYARYTRTPSARRYALVLLLFALGLMSKPMLVTLPFVLLLLDYWPLERFAGVPPRRLLLEKLPLLGMAVISAVVTVFAQTTALQPLTRVSLALRFGNAAVSTVTYIGQMFWPSNLNLYYPLSRANVGLGRVLLALLVLAAISTAVFLLRRRRYLVTGWLWYLIMLAPVIGIVQVGGQAHADRYTYLPQIGLLVALTWGAADVAQGRPRARLAFALVPAAAIPLLAFCAHKQTTYWADSEAIWRRTLACTSRNAIAEQNFGQAVFQKGRVTEAMMHFERALAINPRQASVLSSVGVLHLQMGRAQESLACLEKAVALDPNDGDAHYNLANTLMEIGRATDAVRHYSRAVERDPIDAEAMNNMAWILATTPDPSVRDGRKAVDLAERAESLKPGSPQTSATLAAAYAELGRFDQAVNAAQRALDLAT